MWEAFMDQYQIFISYRREGGADLAGRIADQLKSLGYKVFFDVETMRSGKFNTQLFEAIDQCSDVIVVLPPHALDRCRNKEDWVRQELAYAIKNEKTIIPIMMRGFKFPFFMPKDISDIKFMEGIPASNDYFDAVIHKLEKLLTSKKAVKEVKAKKVTLDEEKLTQGVFLGFKLGRMEFIWDSKFDFAKAEFESSFREIKTFLNADSVTYEQKNYQHFCNSIINFYRANDAQKLYAILIGIFTQRMTLSCSIDDTENKEMLHNLAVSALSTIPSSYIKDKEDFVNIVRQKLENGFELPEVIQEIYHYIMNCAQM